ncbi:MAG: tetratricopeptide repeat protein [Acidobacteria bacterium]|nr:tetratricopeptide repeat protein [Acidobacteriota bacterium]MBI3262414.1 tetratricopeptide repeat protein [Acidobacteriota bacterium]
MKRAVLLLLLLTSTGLIARQEAPQRLFEAGKYQELVSLVGDKRDQGPVEPEWTYLAGHSYLKMNDRRAAKDEFARLEALDESVWKDIGESAKRLAERDDDAALKAATRAVKADADHLYANFQLGLAYVHTSNFAKAADVFAKATQIDPRFAYAYYYAGHAYYKAKRLDQMAKYWATFLKLAPEAPERVAVESIMKTVRGKSYRSFQFSVVSFQYQIAAFLAAFRPLRPDN